MDKYKIIGKLGDGTYGKVTKAVNKKTGEVVAIKAMKQKFYNWEECMNLREVKSLRKLNHENIVKLKEVVRVNNDLYFIFEYVEENLYQVQKNNNNIMDIKDIKSILYQMLRGLAYVHKNGFFHRDLKLENVLMTDNKVKIADFGLAREIRSKPPYTDYVSTRWYRAPELLLRSTTYNSPVDIFAAGCILAELLLGRPLFAGSSEGDQLMKVCSVLGSPSKTEWPEGHKLALKLGYKFPAFTKVPLTDFLTDAPCEAIDLLWKMFEYDPNNRLTAQQCLEHEFFDGVDVPKTSSSRGNLFGIKPTMSNKANKMISPKLMRLNSKKFELERKESPNISKTPESNYGIGSSNTKIMKPTIGKIPGLKSEIGGGFYYKRMPVKSPGTSSSSGSQALKGPSMLAGKKLGSSMPGAKASPNLGNPDLEKSNTSNFGLYEPDERRKSKVGISMLKMNTKPFGYSSDEKINTDQQLYNNNSMINNGGLSSIDKGLSGGGLTKLGRHNI